MDISQINYFTSLFFTFKIHNMNTAKTADIATVANITEIEVSYKTLNTNKPVVKSSQDAYNYLKESWDMNTIELQEVFKILLLNRANQILGVYEVSKGGTAGTLVDAKLIFAVALKSGASSIILSHNHPSGNKRASQADISLTKKLKSAALFLDLEILDHIILTGEGYSSMADEGAL